MPKRGIKRTSFGYFSCEERPADRNVIFAVFTEAMLIESYYIIFTYRKPLHL